MASLGYFVGDILAAIRRNWPKKVWAYADTLEHRVASTRQPQRRSILSDLLPDAHVGYLVRTVGMACCTPGPAQPEPQAQRPSGVAPVIRAVSPSCPPPSTRHGRLTFHPARLRPPPVEESDGRLGSVGSEPVLGGSAPRPVAVALLRPPIRPRTPAPTCPSPPLVGGRTGGRWLTSGAGGPWRRSVEAAELALASRPLVAGRVLSAWPWVRGEAACTDRQLP
mmetsp:Transcript_102817/g.294767  ORF Transcript_102817/g.294767 Transcript_102817/m.294767 type:complete len:223 (-) Transcript_102817:1955-2623(-)